MISLSIFILILVCGIGCYFLQKIGVELRKMRLMVEPSPLSINEVSEVTPPIEMEDEKEDPDSKVVHGVILDIAEEESGRETVEEREYRIEANELKGRVRG